MYFSRLATEEVERTWQETTELLSRITSEPETTLEIVNHLRYIAECDAEVQKLFEAIDYAHDVFMIIKDFQIPIDDEKRDDYMECEDMINRTNDTLKEVHARRQEFIDRLEEKMKVNIDYLMEEIHEIALEVVDPKLLDVSICFSSYILFKICCFFARRKDLMQMKLKLVWLSCWNVLINARKEHMNLLAIKKNLKLILPNMMKWIMP